MKNKNQIHWITQTGVMLALLIVLQAVTKPLGQLVTGTCVNGVLAVTVLFCGMSSGVTVALLSPVFAYLFGIAPQIVTVPAIMAGNVVYVVLLRMITGGEVKRFGVAVAAWLIASAAKFAALYVLVVLGICGVLADSLLTQGVLKKPMLAMLSANFSWPQLITAILGGAVALIVTPVLKKARKREF